MGIYFGTDGLRGIFGEVISSEIACKVGNSLARRCEIHKKVVIGRDTRTSGSLLASAFACGLCGGGVDVVDIGIVPTPVVAYIAQRMNFDYGVVISASHNDANFNGIKIFNSKGFKISESEENEIEKKMLYPFHVGYERLGKITKRPALVGKYKKHILQTFEKMNLKIVLDCACGASYRIAKWLFENLGCKVIALNCQNDGMKINERCGALHPDVVASAVKEHGADMGFAFDGDADRIIACDENGRILDGDDILFLLAKGDKNQKTIVGTSMTNSGLEFSLKSMGKTLLRADVGDKYVAEMMKVKGATLGGEPSGHIINFDFSTTGDGVLTALTIASIVQKEGKGLSKLCNLKHLPQVLINVKVHDKYRTMNSEILMAEILKVQKEIEGDGRLNVRASGTENKIRVMCEHKSEKVATNLAKNVEKLILQLENK